VIARMTAAWRDESVIVTHKTESDSVVTFSLVPSN
jgi:hypothetical protein